MMIYRYHAKKELQDIEGHIEAHSEKEAVEKIAQMGYLPVRIEAEKDTSPVRAHARAVMPSGRIRVREITVFSRQLASLLKSGVPILKALSIISEQSQGARFKAVLGAIYNAIKDGSNLSSVLASYPNIFSALYVAMVRTGEDSGELPEMLVRLADYRLKQEEMLSRLRMAMAYPALMAVVGIATVVFMLAFVMPRLSGIYANMGQDLPLPTRMLLSASGALSHAWLWLALGGFALAASLILRKQLKTEPGKLAFSRLKLAMPLLGGLLLKAELARFSRTLELLIRSGIPILRGIDIAVPVLENEVIKKQLRQSYKALEQGGSFGKSLKGSGVFPLFMSNLIAVGEESGRLDDALCEVAASYERDTDEAIRITATLLEPVMILGMGLIVGFIVVAMLLPVFQINVMMG